MNLWQAYSNATTDTENSKLENALVKQYQPLVSRVWKMNFKSRNYEDSFAQGMVSLWEAIKKWKADERIGPDHEKQFRNFAGRAIQNGIMNYWRNQTNSKQTIASSNMDAFEVLTGDTTSNLSEETRRYEAEIELRKILPNDKLYNLMLDAHGNDESRDELQKKYDYSSYSSLTSHMSEIMRNARKKVAEVA